jgi:hypothetical protein
MYGILADTGIGDERRVKLTDTAQRYLIDQRPEERVKHAQRLVLVPEIMQDLWAKWEDHPPGDSECRSQLIFEHGFTETTADEMLAIYKANIAFANPSGSLVMSVVSEPEPGTQPMTPAPPPGQRPGDKTIHVVGMSTEAVLQGLFTQAPTGADTNQLRIRMDGDNQAPAGSEMKRPPPDR